MEILHRSSNFPHIQQGYPFLNRNTRSTLLSVSCNAQRRHHRRRLSDIETKKKNLAKVENEAPTSNQENEKVTITLDFQEVKKRAEAFSDAAREALHCSAVKAVRFGNDLVDESRTFLSDLRSSISIQRDRRLVITVKRSTIDFAVSALLWSSLLIVVWKVMSVASKKYRWGWEENFTSEPVFKRDRSLGGREVFVGKNRFWQPKTDKKYVKSNDDVFRRRFNPLDALEISRSEKEMAKIREAEAKSSRRGDEKALPGWWPSNIQFYSNDNNGTNEAAEHQSSALLKVIMEKRLSGKDFDREDILELRKLCKISRTRVTFDTLYLRDSFYRFAVNMVLSSCARSSDGTTQISDEKPSEFLAGLADNINLEAERAAIMVNAAVAARTRSSFLQAWALHVQGKSLEAEEEVAKICRIHAAFPPDNNSPEMEMVSQGLSSHLSFGEREQLLELYIKVGGSSMERIASEALGFRSKVKRG